jgi:hypothetical protein
MSFDSNSDLNKDINLDYVVETTGNVVCSSTSREFFWTEKNYFREHCSNGTELHELLMLAKLPPPHKFGLIANRLIKELQKKGTILTSSHLFSC